MAETSRNEPATPAGNGAVRPRRRGLRIVLLVLAAGGLGFAGYWYRWTWTHETTDDAQIEGHVHAVASQVAGSVMAVLVEDNQVVRNGEIVVRIRPDDFDARVAQAAAQLAQAQANLGVAEHNLVVLKGTTAAAIAESRAAVAKAQSSAEAAGRQAEAARSQLAAESAGRNQAEAQQRAAKANEDYAAWDRDRVAALYERNQAAEDEWKRTTTAYHAAEANLAAASEWVKLSAARVQSAEMAVAAADAQVAVAQANVGVEQAKLDSALTGPSKVRVAESQVELARAGVQAAQAQLDFTRLQRAYCDIAAPADGVISKRSVEAGQFLQPGQPFLAVVPLDDTWVVANFKETELRDMRPGQPVLLKVDAYPDHPFHGVVDSVAAGTGARFSLLPPENATGNYVKIVQRVPVKIVLSPGQRDPQRALRPGMNVHVTVDTGTPAAGATSGAQADSEPPR